jgi:hypothetical protein
VGTDRQQIAPRSADLHRARLRGDHSLIPSAVDSDCVELAKFHSVIGIRDSKNPARGRLSMSAGDFAALPGKVKRGEMDL